MKRLLLSALVMLTAIVMVSAQETTYLSAEATTNMAAYDDGKGNTYPVTNVTDGNLSTIFWKGAAQKAGDYILLTLDNIYSIGEVRLYFCANDQPGGAAKIQISTDNQQWTDISTINQYNIGDKNTNYLHLSDADSQQAKYVRLYLESESPLWLQVADFQVYGYRTEKTETPVFSMEDGTSVILGSIEEITITSEEGAVIYYTTDGSWPDENSPNYIYSGESIKLNTTYSWGSIGVLKAVSKADGKDISIMNVLTYTIAAPYCNSSFPSVGESYNYVGQMVNFTTTGAKVNANWTNPASGDINGYVGTIENAFTALPGQTITLNITSKNTTWGAIRVYVDKNGNYQFDDGENIARVGDANTSNDNLSVTQEFTIDATTLGGTYLVRVLYVPRDPDKPECVEQFNSTDPCGTYTQGGYYDFAFHVLTENKEITIDTIEENDAAYATVSIHPDETTAVMPMWKLDEHSVATEELVIDVSSTAEAPEIYIYGDGTISAETIKVNRKIFSDEWTLISLPFELNLSSVRVNGYAARYGGNIRIMEYDAAKRAQNSVDGYTVSGWTEKTSGTIAANEGFAIVVNPTYGAEQVVTFAATNFTMDANDKQIDLEENPGQSNMAGGKSMDADWNLKGNPMLQSHEKGEGYTLYVHNPADNTYTELASTDTHTYTPFVAWFVQSDNDGGFMSMTFSHGTQPAYARSMADNISGYFEININGGEDYVRITELEGSSETYIRNEDAMYFAPLSNKVSQLYLIDDEGVKIASSVVPAPYDEVKLAYKAAVAGVQTLTVTSVIPGTAVYLVDNEEGTETLMNEGSEYSFTSAAGLNSERFAVKTIIDVTGIEESTAETSSVSAVVTGDAVKIYGATAGETIDVYTVNGVMVSSAVAVEGENEISVPAQGVLIVKVGDEVVKIVK